MSPESQDAAAVMMIRPVRFQGNAQTQPSNRFQVRDQPLSAAEAQAAALTEFDALAQALERAGVAVHTFDDTPEPHTPDSIFPNNWVSFHADGTVVLYPMLAENRRRERRDDLLNELSAQHGFHISHLVDLTHHEDDGHFLEGTGSLVLDRLHHVAYACLSPRTDVGVLGDFAQQLDYEVIAFEARDAGGMPIYHTNVLMSVGERFAAVCSACIREDERDAVVRSLRDTGREILDLSLGQMMAFAGNMLELRNASGSKLVALSSQALAALHPAQCELLAQYAGPLVAVPIPTIETLGGGSVRCMLAELHLPLKGGPTFTSPRGNGGTSRGGSA